MIKNLVPNCAVASVSESVNFYQQLGFFLEMAVDGKIIDSVLDPKKTYLYAMMRSGDAGIAVYKQENLLPASSEKMGNSSISLYMEVENLDAFLAKIRDFVKIAREPETTWYGMRELSLRDPDGHLLCFAEKV